MYNSIKNHILNLIRKINGTHSIKEDIKYLHEMQIKQFIVLNNNISFLNRNIDEIENSIIYQRMQSILQLLKPMDVKNCKYIRVGRNNDGGYVMLDNFENTQAAYSFGIADDVSWDEHFAKLNINVFMYDHTIKRLPQKNEFYNFFRTGITGYKAIQQTKTLDRLITENRHQDLNNIIMKMDVEGCEWDVLSQVKSETLQQFSQIVIEFHDLFPDSSQAKFNEIFNSLSKINTTHQIIHVHANTAGGMPYMIGNLTLPSILEITYLRRDVEHDFILNSRDFPTLIDQPTFNNWPDIFLGKLQS
jgi:hypothetical protein